jgi:hypothetical protein
MAAMMAKLYAALRAADVPDDKATAAAEEAANFENSLTELKSVQRLHTWILTFNTAMLIAIFGVLIRMGLGHG